MTPRFRIEKKGVRYVMGGRTFDCLEAVINRYKTEQIVEGHTLGHYIKRVRERESRTHLKFRISRWAFFFYRVPPHRTPRYAPRFFVADKEWVLLEGAIR